MEANNLSYNLAEYYKNFLLIIRLLIFHIRWAIKRYSGGYKSTYTCLVGKTAIITGGNSGLGFATSMMLASRGCRIIIASNLDCESDKEKLIKATNNPNIIIKYVDLANFSSVRKFAEDIRKTETKIDFLINNAGIGVVKKIISDDGLNSVMQINYFGHFLLTHLLIDQLKAAGSARVVFVGSSAAYCHKMEPHDIHQVPKENDNISGYYYLNSYSNAKTCNVIAAKELAKKLGKYGITVNSVDPGIFDSQIVQGVHSNTTSDAWIFNWLFHFLTFAYGSDRFEVAQNTIYVLTGKDVENGEHYFRCSPVFPPYKVNNPEFRKSIWERSESIVGLGRDEKIMFQK